MENNRKDPQDSKMSENLSEIQDNPENYSSRENLDSFSDDSDMDDSTEKEDSTDKSANANLKTDALRETKNYSPHSENSSEKDHVNN